MWRSGVHVRSASGAAEDTAMVKMLNAGFDTALSSISSKMSMIVLSRREMLYKWLMIISLMSCFDMIR